MLEAQKEKQLEERAKFIEKTKNLLVFSNQPDPDKPSKKGKVVYHVTCKGKVVYIVTCTIVVNTNDNMMATHGDIRRLASATIL